MTRRLTNISLSEHRNFLSQIGCECIKIKGGHEKWIRNDLSRPLILQTHVDPVPIHIIKQHLRHLGISNKDYLGMI